MTDENAPDTAAPEAPTIALRGRAIDVQVRGLDPSTTDTVGLIFDANVMADIEERFDAGYRGFVRYEEDVYAHDGDGAELLHKSGEVVKNDDGTDRRDTFYGLEAWQMSMNDRPFFTIRMTIALCLGIPDREAGSRLIEENLADYFTAVGAAFAIANGVDPTTALPAAIAAMENRRKELADAAERAAAAREARATSETPATPGTPGSEPGEEPADRLTSSGD